MAIATGFPFALVLVGMCYSTYRENARIGVMQQA
jgi:choline-glycine betaine transporter